MNELLERYKACIQDLGNIGAPHGNSRSFRVTLNSALTVPLAPAKKSDGVIVPTRPALTIVGLAVA